MRSGKPVQELKGTWEGEEKFLGARKTTGDARMKKQMIKET